MSYSGAFNAEVRRWWSSASKCLLEPLPKRRYNDKRSNDDIWRERIGRAFDLGVTVGIEQSIKALRGLSHFGEVPTSLAGTDAPCDAARPYWPELPNPTSDPPAT